MKTSIPITIFTDFDESKLITHIWRKHSVQHHVRIYLSMWEENVTVIYIMFYMSKLKKSLRNRKCQHIQNDSI